MILSDDELWYDKRWEDRWICQKCRGVCCQRSSCDASPFDFDNDTRKMEAALKTGNWCIDLARDRELAVFKWVDGFYTLNLDFLKNSYDAALFMRPRNQRRPIVDIIHEERDEGPCIFWTMENGCKLPYEERPKYGRAIIPRESGPCINVFNTRNMILGEWHPYADFLYQMVQRYFDPTWYLNRVSRLTIYK